MEIYAGIARNVIKTSEYHGSICGYYKRCQKKPAAIMEIYAGIARNVIKT
jgi:hypothetical protein